MAYERVNWENLPSTKTPVNPDNLNKMDEGIANIDTKINSKQDKLIAGTGIEITGKNIINNIQGNYSTEEVKIGTWIDGKPLYKKVLKINNIRIDATTKIITNILNMDTLINAEGLFINGSNGLYSPYPIYSGTNFLQMQVSQDGTKIGFIGNDTWSANINRTHLFILEYTKTTD